MKEVSFKKADFDNPTFLFKLEDTIKGLLGGFLYKSYFQDFELEGSEHILDFGCGSGVGSRFILKRLREDGHLTCLDTSRYLLNRARKRLGKETQVDFLLGGIRDLGIREHSFDVISIVHVIHDIPPEERQDVVNAFGHVVKPGGRIHIWEPVKASHGMSVKEIWRLLKNAGFWEATGKTTSSYFRGKFLKED
jgi:ubiquinone/menaquinone biosynthesis C-methylase UbiE